MADPPCAVGPKYSIITTSTTKGVERKWQESLKNVNAEQVTTEASFIDDLGADSLDSVELIMAFEEEFGAAIPEEDAEKLTHVGKVIEYLKSKGYGDDGTAPAQ